MSTVKNPAVPCEIPIPGGVSLGTMVTVQGIVPQTSNRFAVNLLCASGDIALHISPRFRENYIARNNVQHMTWGKEERTGGLPIYPGQSFEIIILCEENDFKIAINGNHFVEFNHRTLFSKITSVEIEGDVIVNNIHFGGEQKNLTDTRSPSSASYGFQPRAPSPYANAGDNNSKGTLYPSVPPEPSFPMSGPYPPNPNVGEVPYSSGPSRPSPGPFPTAPSGGLYPSPPPQPSYPPSGPYPNAMNSGGFYPPPPQPGIYPNSRPQYPPQGPSPYPQQPGYGPGSNPSPYPQVPNQDYQGYNPKPSSKPSFFDQAGTAIAGILGPALINKGMRKAQGTNTSGQNQGGQDILGQAAGAIAGLLGGGGLLGSNHHKHKHGILGGALGTAAVGAALTGHLNPIKAAKKHKKAQKKALKYGLPIAGAGLGAYVLHKGLKKGFRRSSSSSSSSCSSSD